MRLKNKSSINFEAENDQVDALAYSSYTMEIKDTSPLNNEGLGFQHLQQVSGVGRKQAESLYENGYCNNRDLAFASQSELAEVDGVSNALAARIKAYVGGVGISADEIVDELEEDSSLSFLDRNTLMVNIHE